MDKQLNKKIILPITALGAFIVPFITSAVNVALPSISRELGVNSVVLNWIPLSFTLSLAAFILPFGRLADILGRKKLLLLGMIVFTLASVLCGLSINAYMLIACRVLQGISGATISVTVVSILTSAYSPGERVKALGLNVAMTYIGLSSGPFLGGILTDYLGWRSIFFASGFIGAIVALLLLFLKQDWAEAKGEKFDYLGSLIYGIALFGIVLGFSLIRSFLGPVLMIVGIISIIGFGFFESRALMPILNMNLIRSNRILTFSSLAALINYSATSAVSYLLSLYLQYIKGYEPARAGLILIAQPVVMTLFSPIAGRLSDRIEAQKVASIGMAITSAGLAFFMFLNKNTGLGYIIEGLLVLGFGFALFSSPNTNVVMSSVEKRYYGIASGVLGAARTIGQTLSMGIASLVLATYMGNVKLSGDHPGFLVSVKVTFVILTILCFIGIFASIARGKTRAAGE